MLSVRMVIDTGVVVAKEEAAGSVPSSVHYSIELFSIMHRTARLVSGL
jgi:hypothetical protein